VILMNDFKAEPGALRDAMLAATARVLDSGWYILGPELEAFERRWAGACGTAFCAGAANGMDAIELILRALDIGPGSEVVTTPMTAYATVLAIVRAGAVPVLADIDAETGLLDPASVKRCLSPRTRAIVLVHLYGRVERMEDWQRLCEEANVHLVEDCAQAHGACWNGKVAGSFGVAGAYSFYPTKNLGALGDGGAVVASDPALVERIRCLRNYGQQQRYLHTMIGMNSRLDELQAALLNVRLDWLDSFTSQRRKVAARYRQGIVNPRVRTLRPGIQEQADVHHLFVVLCERRDELQAHLKAQGVQTLVHYPIPMHRQPPLLTIQRDANGLDRTQTHADQCLSLPCHPQLSDEDVAKVIDAVNSFS
jgi:dTDP-4-amino-4,6-dideoxygalactose transaminase